MTDVQTGRRITVTAFSVALVGAVFISACAPADSNAAGGGYRATEALDASVTPATVNATTTTVAETTTTTTSTTVAPTTTIDPVVADQTAYFIISSAYNEALKEAGDYIDTKADCELAAERNTDFIAGLEDHPWRSEVQDAVDTLIRLKVLELAQFQRCMRKSR